MPNVDLSSLSGPELRRLLDSTRERGDAGASYRILQEMAARRDSDKGRRGLFAIRKPAEPRVLEVDLGDPLEPQDELPPMPNWRPPEPQAAVASEPEPAPRPPRRRKAAPPEPMAPIAAPDPEPPLTLGLRPQPRSVWDDDPEPPPPPARAPKVRVPGLGRATGVGFGVGAALGVALGWWVAGTFREAPRPLAVASAPIQTPVSAPQPLPVTPLPVPSTAEPEPAPETPPEVTAEPAPPELAEGPAPSPDSADVARDATAEVVEPRRPPVVRTTAPSDGCAAAPTPADRTICGDRKLQRLQRELREAYAEALDAHEERDLLRQRQLAWREARNTVSDPARLARLYEQRIRKLNAATAEARRDEEPVY